MALFFCFCVVLNGNIPTSTNQNSLSFPKKKHQWINISIPWLPTCIWVKHIFFKEQALAFRPRGVCQGQYIQSLTYWVQPSWQTRAPPNARLFPLLLAITPYYDSLVTQYCCLYLQNVTMFLDMFCVSSILICDLRFHYFNMFFLSTLKWQWVKHHIPCIWPRAYLEDRPVHLV